LQKVRELQLRLVRGAGGPGVLLWPWHDLTPDDLCFESVNMLAVRGIWQPDRDTLLFGAEERMSRRELARLLCRFYRSLPDAKDWPLGASPQYADVVSTDEDRVFIEALSTWGAITKSETRFNPDAPATRALLSQWLTALRLPVSKSLSDAGARPLSRGEAAQHLWRALQLHGDGMSTPVNWLQPGNDEDGDGLVDTDDPLPFDRDNNNIPDRLEPPRTLAER
jgi:hypothetical protein